jgi:hypothetical protein
MIFIALGANETALAARVPGCQRSAVFAPYNHFLAAAWAFELTELENGLLAAA